MRTSDETLTAKIANLAKTEPLTLVFAVVASSAVSSKSIVTRKGPLFETDKRRWGDPSKSALSVRLQQGTQSQRFFRTTSRSYFSFFPKIRCTRVFFAAFLAGAFLAAFLATFFTAFLAAFLAAFFAGACLAAFFAVFLA